MTEKTNLSPKKETGTQKPLIYILPKESPELKQVVSNEIQSLEKESDNSSVDFAVDVVLSTSSALAVGFNPLSMLLMGWGLKKLKEKRSDAKEDSEETQKFREAAKSQLKRINVDLADWFEFIEEIPFSKIPPDIDFPPGHPLPRRFYRVHPLKDKSNRYIPVEVFDTLLYEERESELIKLLIDLGAVEITIKDLSSNKAKGKASANVSATGTGGFEAKAEGEKENSSSETRLIKLNRKRWDKSQFKRENYNWLAYEPAWETIVHARLEGECILSSIELNSDTSYSISAGLGLTEGFIQQFADVGAGIEFSNLKKESKLFEVKFLDD